MQKMKQQVIINNNNSRAKAVVAFLLFLFALYTSLGQCVIEESACVVYNHDSQKISYFEYAINNKTRDTAYIWIDTEAIDTDSLTIAQKDILLFLKYLRNPKCNIGLDFLCNDGCIDYGREYPYQPVIGCTFIKKIFPGESFLIISLNNSIKKDAIHIINKDIAGRFIKNDRLDLFCYNKPYIIVW